MEQFFIKWKENHSQEIQDTIDYVSAFQSIRSPILEKWTYPFPPDSSSGQVLLLIYASLLQNINEEKLIEWLREWFAYWDKKIFQRQRYKFLETEEVLKQSEGYSNWLLAKQAPAILRSIGSFVREYPKIKDWILNQNSIESATQKLSKVIFYMGKNSFSKPKVRHFIWLLYKSGIESFPDLKEYSLPITEGIQKWTYFIGPLRKEEFSKKYLKENYRQIGILLNSILPVNNDYYHALSCFQKRNKDGQLLCRQILRNCQLCPLSSYCFLSDAG